MGSAQAQAKQQTDIAFRVVANGAKYAPLLVRPGSFNSKIGKSAARKTYLTAYAPKDFPAAMCVSSE